MAHNPDDLTPPHWVEPDPPKCDHDWQRTPYRVGMCIIYECSKCGDEYEKDVS